MPTPFKSIGLLGKPNDPSIAETLDVVYRFLTYHAYEVIVDEHNCCFINEPDVKSSPTESLAQQCDLVIAIGGDGTFLTAAKAIAGHNVPLTGINLGRLGFLVDISPDELPQRLQCILSGDFREEHRYLLRAKILRGGEIIREETALNEVVIHRWITPSMIEIVTKIDNVFLNSQRSDGLIVSTPTGSTAYSLSAGGPILHPALKALVLVPLNPHMLTNRPIVIDDSSEIEISFCQTKQISALVSCDHIEIPDVLISDKILIQKDPNPIKILHPEDHDFYQVLRRKLNWSSGYNNDHASKP